MKLKSLLFGSAAALMAVTGAQAAEPLEPIAEPVDFVRICDAFGTGFFFIPGTDTCLKIGGYVRADAHYTHQWDDIVVKSHGQDVGGLIEIDPLIAPLGPGGTSIDFLGPDPQIFVRPLNERNRNEFTTRARANLNFDSRVQTDIGLIRTYTELWFTVGPGGEAFEAAFDSGERDENYGGSVTFRQFFIQIANDWGTVTAGRAASFFEFWESDAWADIIGEDAPLAPGNLFAVTFALGNGVSASLSAEDAASEGRRRSFGAPPFFPADLNFDGIPDVLVVNSDTGVGPIFPESPGAEIPTFVDRIHGGQTSPDLVANVRVDQGWGSAQIMGVIHPVRAQAFSGPPGLIEAEPDTELGWAAGAGASFDIPGTGITFNIQGVITEGALEYATTAGGVMSTDGVVVPLDLNNNGFFDVGDGTSTELTEAWSVKAGIGGNLAPDWRFNLQGSFARIEPPVVGPLTGLSAGVPGVVPAGVTCRRQGITAITACQFNGLGNPLTSAGLFTSDIDYWTASGHIAWAPVSGFIAGVELAYEQVEFGGLETQRWGGMFRSQKSF
jgi:hypothetical protein